MSWSLEVKTHYNSIQSRIDISYLHIYINNMQKFKYNFMYIQISLRSQMNYFPLIEDIVLSDYLPLKGICFPIFKNRLLNV